MRGHVGVPSPSEPIERLEPAAAAARDAAPAPGGVGAGRVRLGWLAPAVLAAWLAVDVGLRVVPPTRLNVNPFAAAAARPPRGASFAPSFTAKVDNYVGDAVREANAPQTERRAPMRVTVDARGFRANPRLAATDPPDVLLLGGASFGYGAALSDDETLPAVLTRLGPARVYNGGLYHEDDLTVQRLDGLLAALPDRPRAVLFLVVEHEELSSPPAGRGWAAALARAYPAAAPAVVRARRVHGELREVGRRAARWWAFSPLEVMTARLFRRLSDDRVLPNEYARGTRTLTLPDGRPMILRRYELEPVEQGRSPDDAPPAADYLARWRDSLAARGMATHVLLVPSRYTVYGPWLEPRGAQRSAVLRVGAYLDSLATELRDRGIPTVNALPLFRDVAGDELRTGALSFYREDNHWTARGVERVARVVADSLGTWDAAPADAGPRRARE